MKKIYKLFLTTMLLFMVSVSNVFALEHSIDINYGDKDNQTWIPGHDYLGSSKKTGEEDYPEMTQLKKTTNSRIAYCVDGRSGSPGLTEGVIEWNQNCKTITGTLKNQLIYIYKNAYGSTSATSPNKYLEGDRDKDYFLTQVAVWYFTTRPAWLDESIASGYYNGVTNDYNKRIALLINDAKNATAGGSLSLMTSGTRMTVTSDGRYYISNPITLYADGIEGSVTVSVSGADGAFVTTDESATRGETTFSSMAKVYVKVPVSNGEQVSVTLKATANTISGGEIYQCSEGRDSIQDIIEYIPGTSEVSDSKTFTYQVIKGKIRVYKKDRSGQPLANAKLEIRNSGGTPVDTWTSSTSYHESPELEPGNYTIVEISAPTGYVKSTEVISFTIDEYGRTLVNGGQVNDVTITNDPIIITISKRAVAGSDELPGAHLQILNRGNGNGVATDISGANLDWVSSSTARQFHIAPGLYTLVETIAPDGYILNKETIDFEVRDDGKIYINGAPQSGTIVMENALITVKVSKKDVTGKKELAGATLKITDKSGKTVKDLEGNDLQWVSEEGKVKEFHIKAGIYRLVEVKAPDGYKLNKAYIEFEVKTDGKVYVNNKEVEQVEMQNGKISINISKRSITGDKELPGAHLQITDEKGKVAKDVNGKALEWNSENTTKQFYLVAGKYILKETIAPEGYELSESEIAFTVTEDGHVLVDGKEVDGNLIIFRNTPVEEPPQTGNVIALVTMVLGLISLVAVAYLVTRMTKRVE